MDFIKAQRLLTKIEAFLDNGKAHDLSRLEKDLMRSYVIQLYEALADHEEVAPEQEKPIEFVEYKMPKRESSTKAEVPKAETTSPAFTESKITAQKEIPVELEASIPETVKLTPQVEARSFQFQAAEPIKEAIRDTRAQAPTADANEGLEKLFELPKTDEIAGRFNHVPILSIESAMGLNERIFTLNELFGGDKALFDSTCQTLNHLSSFTEARKMLMSGPAKDFKWSEPKRIKMAEQFIRIVSRRYPKSVS